MSMASFDPFCLCITWCALWYVSFAGTITFDFPPSTDILLSSDASIYNDVVQLTKTTGGLGWATYPNAIPSEALSIFSAHFRFRMVAVNGSGDGLTFFLAPFDFNSSAADSGEWLGLFNSQTDGNSSNRIFAVEFDTYKNQFDPDDNHVGIDVNSIKSVIYVSVSDVYSDATLNNGEMWEAWVDYNGSQIQVFLSHDTGSYSPYKPYDPVLVYDIDLVSFLPPHVKVGFSASTGIAIETHELHVWNFTCEYSPEIPITPPSSPRTPNPSPPSSPSTPNPSPPSSPPDKARKHSLIGSIIGIISFGIIVIVVYKCCCSSRRTNVPPAPPPWHPPSPVPVMVVPPQVPNPRPVEVEVSATTYVHVRT